MTEKSKKVKKSQILKFYKRGERMTELKSCPFCGCQIILYTAIYGIQGANDYYAIRHPDETDCILDDVSTPFYADQEELIQDWNRRVKE